MPFPWCWWMLLGVYWPYVKLVCFSLKSAFLEIAPDDFQKPWQLDWDSGIGFHGTSPYSINAQVTVATPRGARIPPAAQEGDWSYCGPKLPGRNIRRFKLQGDQQTSGLSLRVWKIMWNSTEPMYYMYIQIYIKHLWRWFSSCSFNLSFEDLSKYFQYRNIVTTKNERFLENLIDFGISEPKTFVRHLRKST